MKIALATGSRADWGILEPLAKLMHEDKDIDLQILVTGIKMN